MTHILYIYIYIYDIICIKRVLTRYSSSLIRLASNTSAVFGTEINLAFVNNFTISSMLFS